MAEKKILPSAVEEDEKKRNEMMERREDVARDDEAFSCVVKSQKMPVKQNL